MICLPMAGTQQVLVIFIPVLNEMCDDYVVVIPSVCLSKIIFVVQVFQYLYH